MSPANTRGHPTSLRIPPDLDAWLTTLSEERNIPRTQIILDIVRAYKDGRLVRAKGARIRKDL